MRNAMKQRSSSGPDVMNTESFALKCHRCGSSGHKTNKCYASAKMVKRYRDQLDAAAERNRPGQKDKKKHHALNVTTGQVPIDGLFLV